MKPFSTLVASLAIFLAVPSVRADVWDEGPDSDNTCGGTSDNEFVHGTSQVHDLATRPGPAADEDNYTVTSRAYASYEVLIDGTTGDLNNGGAPNFDFDRLNVNCISVQPFEPVGGFGFSRSIRWETGDTLFGTGLRVSNPACGTACTTDDQYHIQFRETTYTIPRFNNSSSQFTILIIQNPTHYAIHLTPWFFDNAGTLIATASFTIAPRGTLVFNTSTIGALQGQSGSVILSNTGRYGDLSGKAVALEPATGFTFDTAMAARAY